MKKQQKILLFVVLCIVIVFFAVYIWANQTGRITIFGSEYTTAKVQSGPVIGNPICKSVTVSDAVAGWYDSSTGGLLKADSLCSGYTAECRSEGTMSEGWYKVKGSYVELIKWDNCAGKCVPGQKKCDGEYPCTCSSSGSWACQKSTCAMQTAGTKCNNGSCIASTTPTSVPTSSATATPTTTTNSECSANAIKCIGDDVYVCDPYKVTPGDLNSAIYWKWTYRINCSQYGDGSACRKTYCSTTTPTSPASSPTSTTMPTSTTTTTSIPTSTPTSTVQTPSVPTNLQASSITDSSVILTWDSVLTAVSYGIYNAEAVAWVGSSDTNSYTINGLNCATDYSFQVTAVNDEGYGSNPTDPVSFTTGVCQDVTTDISTQKPENVQIDNDGISVTISWDSIDDANGYDIYDCSGNYIISTDNIEGVSRVSYTFSSSSCGTSYCYYVVAHDAGGNNSLASDQVSTTIAACSTDSSNSTDSTTTSITSLVSTGSSLWFNLLVGFLLALGIGYFMFRSDIKKEE